ncbi:unnamed protein product [Rhodiola kirilowii]
MNPSSSGSRSHLLLQTRDGQRQQRQWCPLSLEEYLRWEFNAVLWILLVGTTSCLLRELFHLLRIRLWNSPKVAPPSCVVITDVGFNSNPRQNLNVRCEPWNCLKIPRGAVLVVPLICNASEFDPEHFIPTAEEGKISARM